MSASGQGIGQDRWMVIPRTLCFLTFKGEVLLMKRGMHKRVFPGLYNGIGGHIERGEDPFRAALREVEEETGLKPSVLRDFRLRGICHIDAKQDVGIMLFVFSGQSLTREVRDCDEGDLYWVPLEAVEALPCVDDLPVLLPRLFGEASPDRLFFAKVHYDDADQRMTNFAE